MGASTFYFAGQNASCAPRNFHFDRRHENLTHLLLEGMTTPNPERKPKFWPPRRALQSDPHSPEDEFERNRNDTGSTLGGPPSAGVGSGTLLPGRSGASTQRSEALCFVGGDNLAWL